MRNLYKRIVTIGMISFSATLAWVYCILVYRTQPAYVIGVSLVAVASLYALLLALVDLKMKRDEKQQLFVSQTMQNLIEKQNNTEEFITLERLLKASYTQHRKTNERLKELTEDTIRIAQERADGDKAITELLQKQLVEALNKAVKVTLKYNQNNNDKMLSATREITGFVTAISSDVEKLTRDLEALYAEVHAMEFPSVIEVAGAPASQTATDTSPKVASEDADTDTSAKTTSTDADTDMVETSATLDLANDFDTTAQAEVTATDTVPLADVIPFPTAEEQAVEEEPVAEAPIEEATASTSVNQDSNRMLSPDEIAALFASAEDTKASTKETVVEEAIVQEPVEEAPVNQDSNRMLSPDEIAALFASAEGTKASTEETVEEKTVEETPVAEAPVEEAPVAETPVEEATAPTPVNQDANRMLSPDEIAALFASAGNTNASTEETVEEKPVAEETVKEAPVAEEPAEEATASTPANPDSNRMLSQEEIAALFASAGN